MPRDWCEIPDCEEHYGCRLRNKGLNISPRAQMSRTQNWKPTPSVPVKSNGDYLYDERKGGTRMPILGPDGTHLQRYDKMIDPNFDKKLHRIKSLTEGAH